MIRIVGWSRVERTGDADIVGQLALANGIYDPGVPAQEPVKRRRQFLFMNSRRLHSGPGRLDHFSLVFLRTPSLASLQLPTLPATLLACERLARGGLTNLLKAVPAKMCVFEACWTPWHPFLPPAVFTCSPRSPIPGNRGVPLLLDRRALA